MQCEEVDTTPTTEMTFNEPLSPKPQISDDSK